MAVKTKKTNKKKPSSKGKKKTVAKPKAKIKKKQKNSKKLSKPKIAAVIIAIVLIIATILSAVIIHSKTNHTADNISKVITKDTAWGVDLSSHNGKVNWQKVKNKADFAFIRAGYRGYAKGEINADKQMKNNLKGANKYGVPVGVYFYSQAVNEEEAIEEAKYVLKKIEGYKIELPIVIDFEYAIKNGKRVGRLSNAKLNNKKRTNLINAFCKTVREAGYIPGIYASSYIYRLQLNMNKIDDDVIIWVADYNKNVTYKGYYDIWQYSEKGSCAGVKSKNVDTNYWYISKRK